MVRAGEGRESLNHLGEREDAQMRKVAILALAAASGVASAQVGLPELGRTSVRVGYFLPTNRDADSEGGLAFGVDYRLRQLAVRVPATSVQSYLTLSGDYYRRGDSYNIPFLLNYSVQAAGLFGSAGIGFGYHHNAFDNEGGIGLNAQIGVGYEFALPIKAFVQAKYYFSPREEMRGIGLFAGVRF